MSDPDHCQRCDVVLNGGRFTLRVEAEPPATKTLTLRVCDQCRLSFNRWLDRGSQSRDEVGASGRTTRRSGRRRETGRRSPYTAALDREVDSLQANLFAVAAGIVLAAAGLAGLIVYWLFKR